jgi:hypothetical protein
MAQAVAAGLWGIDVKRLSRLRVARSSSARRRLGMREGTEQPPSGIAEEELYKR